MLKINEILEYNLKDLQDLNLASLFNILKKMKRTAKNRYETLKKKKRINTPYTKAYSRSRKFVNRYYTKNKNKMIQQFFSLKNLLTYETSTVTGVNRIKRNFKRKTGINLSNSQTEMMFNVLNRIKEYNPVLSRLFEYKVIMQNISDVIVENPDADVDEIFEKSLDKMEDLYEDDENFGGEDELF